MHGTIGRDYRPLRAPAPQAPVALMCVVVALAGVGMTLLSLADLRVSAKEEKPYAIVPSVPEEREEEDG